MKPFDFIARWNARHGATGPTGTPGAEAGPDWNSLNRTLRRAVGFRGRVVPIEWFPPETRTFVPRYVRRNWEKVAAGWNHTAHTRRERRIRARIMRSMAAYGMGPL